MLGPTVKEKIIIHLSRFHPLKYEGGPVPYYVTQDGIAEAVSASRNYVAVVIGRMEKKGEGLVFSDTRHVRAQKKRKVYFLTSKGFEAAQEIIKKYRNRTVRVITGDRKVIHVPFRDISKYIGEKDSIARGILMMNEDGIISLYTKGIKAIKTFVGRETYIKKFKEILKSSESINKKCIFISGSAGIGKTTLALKFGELAKSSGFAFLMGRCYANMDVPYFPLISLFQNRDSNVIYTSKIINIFRKDTHLPVENREIMNGQRNAMWYDVARILEKTAKKKPLMLFIDDVQWADDTTVAMLTFLCEYLRDIPVFFLFTYIRDGGIPPNIRSLLDQMAAHGSVVSFNIEPFSIKETHKLLSALIKDNVSEDITRKVQEITQGNPLFISEIVSNLKLKGNGSHPSVLEEDNISIPSRLEGLLLSKAMNLSASTIDILKIASVIGQSFPLDVLRYVAGIRREDLLKAIAELVDTGFIVPTEQGSYAFSHPLIHLIIYRNVPDKINLHRTIANITQKMLKDDENIISIINLGFHYERCGEFEKSIKYYMAQANAAKRRFAYEDSIHLMKSALYICKTHNILFPIKNILKELANLCSLRGKYEEAIEKYKELLHLSKTVEEKQETYLKIAQVYRQMGSFDLAMNYVDMGLEVSKDPSPLRVKLFSEKLWIRLKSGNMFDVEKMVSRMGEIALSIKDDESIAIYYENMATIYHYKGKIKDAIKYLDAEMKIKNKIGNYLDLSIIYTNMGILLAQNGNIKKAIKYFKKSKKIEEEIGNLRGGAQIYTNLGVAYHKLGFLKKSLKMFEEAKGTYQRIGSNDSLAIVYLNMGNVFKDMGQFIEAIEKINDSIKIFEKIGDKWGLCHAYRAMGEANMNDRKDIDALCWIRKAINIAKNTDNDRCLFESYIDLAKIYMNLGEEDLAREIVKRVEKMTTNTNDPYAFGEKDFLKGLVHFSMGEYNKSTEFFKLSQKNFSSVNEEIFAHTSLYYLGLSLMKIGDTKNGKEKIWEACKWFGDRDILYLEKLCNTKL